MNGPRVVSLLRRWVVVNSGLLVHPYIYVTLVRQSLTKLSKNSAEKIPLYLLSNLGSIACLGVDLDTIKDETQVDGGFRYDQVVCL